MIVLVVIEYLCNYFVAYKGHVMGVYMERDLRNELFKYDEKSKQLQRFQRSTN